MKLKIALLAAAGAFSLTTAVNAQEGMYGSLGAGWSFDGPDNDFEDRGDAFPNSFTSDLETDDNIAVQGALGKYFANGWRGELELSTRTKNIEAIPGDGLGFAGFPGMRGDVSQTSLMLNAIKDFNSDTFGRLTPYVGVGLGAARFDGSFDNISTVGTAATALTPNAPYLGVVGDHDYALAYQGLVGVVFDLADNMAIDLKYRYMDTAEFKYGAFINGSAAPVSIDSEFGVQEVSAAWRWNFGAPAAAAVPVAAAAAIDYKDCWDGSRVVVTADCPPEIMETVDAPTDLALTVYFDYDKSNLTDAAQSLIAAKSAEAKEYDIKTVTVQGNTDTAGSSAYNNALSARRGSVVREALVSNGIPADAISVEALGESNPAKATDDGTREPLNRRTDVKFGF